MSVCRCHYLAHAHLLAELLVDCFLVFSITLFLLCLLWSVEKTCIYGCTWSVLLILVHERVTLLKVYGMS